MPRFEGPPDPLFARINASIGFDRRLWREDIEGSRAHAAGLERAGVITADELAELERGLGLVAAELEGGEFEVSADDEDIHMAVERRLTELVGPVGGKLHTGRSRNDQVATDLALFVRGRAARAGELIGALMARLLTLAEAHRDWRMPGYTHLQRAQPVYLGHHLLAYFWMLERDAIRFEFAAGSTMAMPLGSGALAGLNWELDRDATAAELGFARPSPNSIDAVSNRDFALDYLYAASVCATHLSRLGSEIVIWSSQEFGFCEPDDRFSSGSSLMPQKKNPDAAELLRAKSPRVSASLATLLGVLHALPLAYSKDLQEDKEALFDAVDTVEICLEAAERHARGPALRPRAPRRCGRRRDGRGDRRRRPAGPQGDAVSRGPRRRRRPRPRGDRGRQAALRARPRGARRVTRSSSTTSTTRCSARGRGSIRSSRPAVRSAARLAEQLEAARRALERARRPRRGRRERARRRLLRSLGPRGRARADRLRAARSTASAG